MHEGTWREERGGSRDAGYRTTRKDSCYTRSKCAVGAQTNEETSATAGDVVQGKCTLKDVSPARGAMNEYIFRGEPKACYDILGASSFARRCSTAIHAVFIRTPYSSFSKGVFTFTLLFLLPYSSFLSTTCTPRRFPLCAPEGDTTTPTLNNAHSRVSQTLLSRNTKHPLCCALVLLSTR